MMSPPAPLDSSASWATRVPPFLLEAWREAGSERLDPGEKLRVRLHLGWMGIRTLVGVVSSVWAAVRPPHTKDEFDTLSFDRESWGTWVAHGERSAKAASDMLQDGHAPAIVRLWLADHPESVLDAAKRVVEIRNRAYHGRFGGEIAPDEAERAVEELRAPLLKLISGLRMLASFPIVWLEDLDVDRGDVVVRIVAAFGAQPDTETILFPRGFSVNVPCLLLPDGSLLRLDPWVAVGKLPGRATASCGLVARRGKGGLEYETGSEPLFATANDLPPGSPRLLPNVVPAAQVANLLGVPSRPAPTRVGAYQILERLGHGATAVVYRARDTRSGASSTEVALKVLRPELVLERELRERFRREAVTLARIRHPGVVGVVDHGEDDEHGCWIAMELVRGGSLADMTAALPLRPHVAVRFTLQVLDALEHVHAHKIIHRDVKPSNVLIDGDQARLVDFGIAHLADAAGLTRSLHASGTLSFAAPEQLDGRRVDPRSDVFAVGRMLHALVHGQERMPGLVGVTRRATQADPARRYASAREMRDALAHPDLLSGGAAPVAVEDRIGAYRITGDPVAVAPGLWWVQAVTQSFDGTRGLLLAFDDGPKEALRGRVRGLDRPQKTAIGFDGIDDEEDVLVVVLDRRAWDPQASAVLLGAPRAASGSTKAYAPPQSAAATPGEPLTPSAGPTPLAAAPPTFDANSDLAVGVLGALAGITGFAGLAGLAALGVARARSAAAKSAGKATGARTVADKAQAAGAGPRPSVHAAPSTGNAKPSAAAPVPLAPPAPTSATTGRFQGTNLAASTKLAQLPGVASVLQDPKRAQLLYGVTAQRRSVAAVLCFPPATFSVEGKRQEIYAKFLQAAPRPTAEFPPAMAWTDGVRWLWVVRRGGEWQVATAEGEIREAIARAMAGMA